MARKSARLPARFSKPSAALSTAKILLVDDDPAFLEAIRETLRLRLPDIRIEICSNPHVALNQVAQTRFDVIISDFRMPTMNGLALLRAARMATDQTSCILISGHLDFSLLSLAQQAGVFEVLSKPLDRDALVTAIKRGLKGVAPSLTT